MLSPESRRALDQAEADLSALVLAHLDLGQTRHDLREIPTDEYPDLISVAVAYIVRLAAPVKASADLFGSILDDMGLRR